MEVIEIQSEAFVHVHLILTPEGVTAAHIYTPSMRQRGHAIVCAYTYTHSDTQYQWQRVSQKTRRLHMDSLDISHWLCDLVMQSALIPTYDECTLEWGKFAEGSCGWLKERYEAAVRGCVSKEVHDQQAKHIVAKSTTRTQIFFTGDIRKQERCSCADHVSLVETWGSQ